MKLGLPVSSLPYEKVPPDLRDQLDLLRGVCFCVLYDVSCWMNDTVQPVPVATIEYALTDFRGIPEPRRRLAGYCDPTLLERWDAALGPFLGAGFRFSPEFGDEADLREEGLEQGAERITVEVTIRSRSAVIMPGTGRPLVRLPPREWTTFLLVSLTENAGYIHDGCVRPGKPLADPTAGETLPATLDPFALLAATPALTDDLPSPVYLRVSP